MKAKIASSSVSILFAVLCTTAFVSVVGTTSAWAADETFNNASVIDMHKLGLGDGVIIEKIKTSRCDFDSSLAELKKLKDAGISDTVIQAMVGASAPAKLVTGTKAAMTGDPNDPNSPHEAGIYILQEVDGKRKMTKIEPSVIGEVKTGSGWGVAWGGTAKSKAVLDGVSAALQISNPRPVFYFYFEETASGLSHGGSITSPNEFGLAQMELRNDKKERRLTVGKYGMGGAKSGTDSKQARQFSSEQAAPGVFKVTPQADLVLGEYCFFPAGTGAAGGAWGGAGGGGGKLWDFGIAGAK